MKILFFTSIESDYLQDSLLVGLRNIYGENLVDFPKKDWLYATNNIDIKLYKRQEYTFFRCLEDIDVNRENIRNRILDNEFDIIIFSSIHRQIDILKDYYNILKNRRVAIVDGEDHPAIFGYGSRYWKDYKKLILPKVHKRFIYFKRELMPKTVRYRYYKILPSSFFKKIKIKNVFPISFAFPESKISVRSVPKEKLLPEHIVDEEIALRITKSESYVFDNEADYFHDLQISKFGITTKRAGWDCMRHYEIAANKSIICFKNLDKKSPMCAPKGLNSSNCIIYSDYDDLMRQINSLSPKEYDAMLAETEKWLMKNTCGARAEYLISQVEAFYAGKNVK